MPCRAHLAQLRERQEELDRLGAAVVVVTFEPPARVAQFVGDEALPYPVLSDPARRAYAAFGLRRGRARRVWSGGTVRAYLRGFRAGLRPRLPHGDLAQLGGDFVLDPAGRIVFAHRGEEPADRPAVDDILAAVRRAVRTAREGDDHG